MTEFTIVPLDGRDRSEFRCGTDALDRYFIRQASQDARRRIAGCYVALDKNTGSIAGFYTLSAASIPIAEFSQEAIRRLPYYPTVPAALLGRLAVVHRFQCRKLGTTLLANAILRAA